MSPIELQAVRITPAAKAWLESDHPARPLHVFNEVCNLVDAGQAVLSLQTDRIPPAPNSLVVASGNWGSPGFPGYIEMESQVSREPGGLRVGDLIVEWATARAWDPSPDWEALRAVRADWGGQLVKLRQLALRESPPGGLTPLLAPAAELERGQTFGAGVVQAARPLARRLISAIREEKTGEMLAAAQGLAGLGGGLTPSGDDYLVGVMHAIWCREEGAKAGRLSREICGAAVPRTTPLSAEWLRAAARGEAGGNWHEVLAALYSKDAASLSRAARGLLHVGHSSGADALAGFLGMLLT